MLAGRRQFWLGLGRCDLYDFRNLGAGVAGKCVRDWLYSNFSFLECGLEWMILRLESDHLVQGLELPVTITREQCK